jgi:hypothetical protein
MATFAQNVQDRVSTICASAPFAYRSSREPFGIDQQPHGDMDKIFTVGMALLDTEGMIGYHQQERWEVTIGLTRTAKTEPATAYRALVVDVGSLVAALVREGATEEYFFEDAEFQQDIPDPDETDAMLTAELTGVANFERAV